MEELETLVLDELKENMEKIIHAFEKSLQKVRTGRASPSLLDGIRVEYYGVPTPLNQLATISVPESRLIVIAPWDASAKGGIERAILKSDLGLTPMNDGKVIRIAIPPLTEQRRRELVKAVKKMAEECKIKLRNARRDANEQLKSLKKDNQISEDDLYADQQNVQAMTDSYIAQTGTILAAKEREIMEI